jgi:hypothetical protein
MCNTDFLKPLGEIKGVTQVDIGECWAVRGYCSCKPEVIEAFKPNCEWWYYRISYSQNGKFFFQANVKKTAAIVSVPLKETTLTPE